MLRNRYIAIDTQSVDDINALIHRSCLGESLFVDNEKLFRLQIDQVPIRNLTTAQVSCSGGVIFSSGPGQADYGVICWTRGAGVLKTTTPVDLKPGSAAAISLDEPWSLTTRGSCEFVMLQFKGRELTRQAERLLDRRTQSRLKFRSGAWRTDAGASMESLVRFLCRWFNDAGVAASNSSPVLEQTENLLAALVLDAVPHNFSHELNSPPSRRSPWYVRLAMEYIDAHLDEAITTDSIGKAIGISPATLREAFRQNEGRSPMQHLRLRRLQRVRAELAKRADEVSVTEVAMNWGFHHLGRFSGLYSKAFGEKPSETLRRNATKLSAHHA